MRQSKFTETQIVAILREADDGRPVNEIWWQYGISSATYYKWKAKYGGLEASDVKRLKELEHENRSVLIFVSHQRGSPQPIVLILCSTPPHSTAFQPTPATVGLLPNSLAEYASVLWSELQLGRGNGFLNQCSYG